MNKPFLGTKLMWIDVIVIFSVWVAASIYLSGCAHEEPCDKYINDVQVYFSCIEETR